MGSAEAKTARQWLEDFARTAEDRETLDYLVTVLDDRIVEEVPEFRDPVLRGELHASSRSHWKGFLAVVSRDTIEFAPTPQIYGLARTLARRGFDLTVLLSVYRAGRKATWDFITETLNEQVGDPAVRSAVLMQFWTHAAYWIDTAVESLIVVFTAEREQWQRGTLARQAEAVAAVLAGQSLDVDATVTSLGYPLRQHHTAFLVSVAETAPDADVQRLLESAARTVSAGLGAARPLMIPCSTRTAWCWAATPGQAPTLGDEVTAELHPLVRVAVGGCHSGLDGFRISHAEALAALSVADPAAPLTRFADVEIACLAAGILNEEARSAFVRRELGSLAASDETSERLRETLRVYLANGADAVATGEHMRLHPNTVRYRVRQAEKSIGHPIQRRLGRTELALEIIAVLGISK